MKYYLGVVEIRLESLGGDIAFEIEPESERFETFDSAREWADDVAEKLDYNEKGELRVLVYLYDTDVDEKYCTDSWDTGDGCYLPKKR